ncbi:MAG TPA: hypothetical protein VNK05_05855 [Chloroflexota bacterium]|nr:hypothetical protein [Chloroflexota bacterium]
MLPAEARPAPAPGGGLVAGSTVVAGELRVREQTEGAAVSRPERGRAPGRPAVRLPGRDMREGHPGLACASYAAPEPAFSGRCDIRGLPLRDRTRS